MDLQIVIFQFLGGLGLFLFAIKYLGDGLQKVAGNRLRNILDRFTSNPILGVLVGIVVTGIIQSSTVTTVLTISLVNVGLMTLRQAIGVIMGANIGTTVTAFIIGFDVGIYAYILMAIGGLILFLFKKDHMQNVGQILFGLSGIFVGIEMLGSGMVPIKEWELLQQINVHFSEFPVFGVITGVIITVLIQSSSASVGILQEMYEEGLISLSSALPILFGDNIGTTFTVIIASISMSSMARRAALSHLFFNLNGTILFLIFFPLFTWYIEWLSTILNLGGRMQIAFAHGSFNVINTLIQLPFVGIFAYVLTKLFQGSESTVDYGPKYLEKNGNELHVPSNLLIKAKNEVVNMGEMAVNSLQESLEYHLTSDTKHIGTIKQLEAAINQLNIVTTEYLVKISKEKFSDNDMRLHYSLYQNILDIERIGDTVENLIELIGYRESQHVKFSKDALVELNEMYELVLDTISLSILAIDKQSIEFAMDVISRTNRIDELERAYRKKHIERLNSGSCDAKTGIVYGDMIDNLKRMGNYAVNIAETVIIRLSNK